MAVTLTEAAALYGKAEALLGSVWNSGEAFFGPWTSHHDLAAWTPAIVPADGSERALTHRVGAFRHNAALRLGGRKAWSRKA